MFSSNIQSRFIARILCALATTAVYGYVSAESVGCDDDYVELNDTQAIIVEPTGMDDTVNIQCALDAAKTMGIPTVRLGKHTYYISSLVVENFKATFEGTTIALTILEIIDGSIDCEAFGAVSTFSSAIKFRKGEPRIRYLTIRANDPCMNGDFLYSALQFTGRPASDPQCGNDVIFGVVDRVKIQELSAGRLNRAIRVQTDTNGVIECNKLLGTFKLNRSEINTRRGISLEMKAGAQVDINFNKFILSRGPGIDINDANQSTTIFSNEFELVKGSLSLLGGFINVSAFSTATNRVVIHKNMFDVADLDFGEVIHLSSTDVSKKISAVITDNTLADVPDPDNRGITFISANTVSNGHMSGNKLGNAREGIVVSGESSGWTIVNNSDYASGWQNIRLGPQTFGCIVGPDQDVLVSDQGTGNSIL